MLLGRICLKEISEMFKQAIEIVTEYGQEDFYSKREIKRLVRIIRKLDYCDASIMEIFTIFDALGLSDERDEESEALYDFIGVVYMNLSRGSRVIPIRPQEANDA